jgi:beta-hydroxyacyl-ACP dehydratase FabZ
MPAEPRPTPSTSTPDPAMDIRGIMRFLPHRYPFLMVDRVLQIDGDRRAVAIKNVSINEPYFVGHYPGQPIMPGVMILEAMAQLSGLLVGRQVEAGGKVAVLLSMDRVKLRRPVRPGDQLLLEAETVHVHSRTGHCRCRAMVGQELAAEAEIKFMLVDPEPT